MPVQATARPVCINKRMLMSEEKQIDRRISHATEEALTGATTATAAHRAATLTSDKPVNDHSAHAPKQDTTTGTDSEEEVGVLPQDKEHKAPRTRGWWLFDFLNYFIVNWAFNIGLSMLMANAKFNYKEQKNADPESVKAGNQGTLPGRISAHFKNFFYGNGHAAFHNKISNPLWNGAKTSDSKFWNTALTKRWKGIAHWIIPPKKWNIPFVPNKSEVNAETGLLKMGEKGAGIMSDVFLLSWGGTFLLYPIKKWEDAKPRTVRFFDRQIDKLRGIFGHGPDEAEMEARGEIYERLDGDLRSESWPQLINSRFWSVASVVATIFTFSYFDGWKDKSEGYSKSVDQIKKEHTTEGGQERRGLFWTQEWVFQGLHKANEKRVKKGKEPWKFLSEDIQEQEVRKSRYMARMWVTEIVGTSITSGIAYLYLKAGELFGKKSKAEKQAAKLAKKQQEAATLKAGITLEEETPMQEVTTTKRTGGRNQRGPRDFAAGRNSIAKNAERPTADTLKQRTLATGAEAGMTA